MNRLATFRKYDGNSVFVVVFVLKCLLFNIIFTFISDGSIVVAGSTAVFSMTFVPLKNMSRLTRLHT